MGLFLFMLSWCLLYAFMARNSLIIFHLKTRVLCKYMSWGFKKNLNITGVHKDNAMFLCIL